MSENEWVDVSAAAELCHRSAKTIRRHVQVGNLPSRKVTVQARTGLPVVKILMRFADLDALFGGSGQRKHVRKIRKSGPPFSEEQLATIRGVFIDHFSELEQHRIAD